MGPAPAPADGSSASASTWPRHLLETTDWPVDLVADRAGFGNGGSLRQHLHAAVGVTPQAYRRTFRPAAADGSVQ